MKKLIKMWEAWRCDESESCGTVEHLADYKYESCAQLWTSPNNWTLNIETWTLNVRSWKLSIESWTLKVEDWKLKIESWRLKVEGIIRKNGRSSQLRTSPSNCHLWWLLFLIHQDCGEHLSIQHQHIFMVYENVDALYHDRSCSQSKEVINTIIIRFKFCLNLNI